MWHQTPTFNRATVGTRRWMGQGSTEALPASGFRHLLGDKKKPLTLGLGPTAGVYIQASEGNQGQSLSRMAGQGCVDRAVVGPGWDISSGCSRAGDVFSGLSGAGTDSSGGWNAILHCGRGSARDRQGHLFPNRVSPVLKLKQSNQKSGFPTLLYNQR